MCVSRGAWVGVAQAVLGDVRDGLGEDGLVCDGGWLDFREVWLDFGEVGVKRLNVEVPCPRSF